MIGTVIRHTYGKTGTIIGIGHIGDTPRYRIRWEDGSPDSWEFSITVATLPNWGRVSLLDDSLDFVSDTETLHSKKGNK